MAAVLAAYIVLSGIVVDERGQPVPGATIEAWPREFGSSHGPDLVEPWWPEPRRAMSGADGRFEIQLPTTDYCSYRVTAPGRAPHEGMTHERAPLRIVLGHGHEVTVKVSGHADKATVRVHAVGHPAPLMELPLPPSGAASLRLDEGRYVAVAVCPGRQVARQQFRVAGATSVALSMVKGEPLEVVVRDVERAPVVGARVVLECEEDGTPPGAVGSGRTGKDGRLRLASPPPCAAPLVSVEHRAHQEIVREVANVVDVEGQPTVDVVLTRGASVAGRVRAPSGSPIQGALVRASVSMGMRTVRVLRSWSDADGRFAVERLAPGPVRLWVEAVGFDRPEEILEAHTGRDAEIVLRPGATLRGAVLTEAGAPVAGARVEVNGATFNPAATTDTGGRFELSNVTDRPAGIVVRAEGYQVAYLERADTGEALEVRLAKGGHVSGTVVAKATGRPVADATVMLDWAGEFDERPTFFDIVGEEVKTDERGEFAYRGVSPGPYRIMAYHDGHAPTEPVALDVRLGEPVSRVLELPPGVSLTGVVVRAGDKMPVPGVTVSGPTANEHGHLVSHGGRRFARQAITDAEGRFRFDGLTGATAEIATRHPDYEPTITSATLSPSGAAKPITIGLGSGGRIEGRLLWGGEAVADALVYTGAIHTRTDAAGAFVLDHVPAGEATVKVMASRGGAEGPRFETRQATRELVVTEGGTHVLPIEVLSGATIRGKLTYRGAGVEGSVWLQDGTHFGSETDVGPGGAFEIPGARAGKAVLVGSAHRDGSSLEIRREIDVPAEGTLDVALEIAATGIRGIVRDRATGKGIAEALVEVGERRGVNALADATGAFEIPGLDPGRYQVVAMAGRDYVPIAMDVVVPAGGVADDPVEIALPPRRGSYTVTGRVLPSDGSAMPWCQVEIAVGSHTIAQARTKQDGTFRLEDVPEGKFLCRARGAGGGRTMDIDVGPRTPPLEIDLEPLATLVVTVSRGGAPVKEAALKVDRPGMDMFRPFHGDRFALGGLDPGPVTLLVKSGTSSKEETAVLERGRETVLSIELP